MISADPITVFITAPNKEEARLIAERLVTNRLAACFQILPEIESIYRWQGKFERQLEVLLIGKTTRENFADLEAEVRRIHSYETPEIVAVSITEASLPYLDWLINSTSSETD